MGHLGHQLEQQLPGLVDHKIQQALQVMSDQQALPAPLQHIALHPVALHPGSVEPHAKATLSSKALTAQLVDNLGATSSCFAEGATQCWLAAPSA